MSNNKQSSVDWLINEHFGGVENCTPDFRRKIEQAKAMDKERMIIFAIWFNNRNNEYQSYENIVEQFYKE